MRGRSPCSRNIPLLPFSEAAPAASEAGCCLWHRQRVGQGKRMRVEITVMVAVHAAVFKRLAVPAKVPNGDGAKVIQHRACDSMTSVSVPNATPSATVSAWPSRPLSAGSVTDEGLSGQHGRNGCHRPTSGCPAGPMTLLRWKAGNMLPKTGKKLHREPLVDAGGQIDVEIGCRGDHRRHNTPPDRITFATAKCNFQPDTGIVSRPWLPSAPIADVVALAPVALRALWGKFGEFARNAGVFKNFASRRLAGL